MRLIDADEIRKSIRESIDECVKWADEVEESEMYARVSQSIGTFIECSLRIKNAPTVDVLEQIRQEIDDLDRHYDNDYFSGNRDAMFKCNDVLQIIDKYR